MDQFTFEQYIAALYKADEATQKLLNSERLYDYIEVQLKSNQTNIPVKELLLPFGYFMVGLVSQADLEAHLNKVGVPDTNSFILAIKNKHTGATASQQKPPAVSQAPEQTIPEPETGVVNSTSQEDLLTK